MVWSMMLVDLGGATRCHSRSYIMVRVRVMLLLDLVLVDLVTLGLSYLAVKSVFWVDLGGAPFSDAADLMLYLHLTQCVALLF